MERLVAAVSHNGRIYGDDEQEQGEGEVRDDR